jgi:glycolate oxidase FAD binding subunit
MGDLEALAPQLGDALRFHDPVAVDGVPVNATIEPRDEDDLAAILVALGDARCAAIPLGAGTQLGFGNPPLRADCFVSLAAFAQIDDLDASEGVCHAGAGTKLADLRARVAEAGWELPLDDGGRGGTLGGALATAALAPRALGFGRPRDIVLGCEIVLGDGLRTRCGGRVVKNVTGYDMAKLYIGSLGSLGVLTGVWLRLAPRPEIVRVLQSEELVDDEEAVALGAFAARLTTARSCLLADEAHGVQATVELAGDAASVECEARELAGRGCRAADPALLDAVAARRFATLSGGMRIVVSALPTQLAACVSELRGAPADLLVLPGLGLVCARGSGAEAALLFESAARAARVGGGRMLCERAPLGAKRGRDVFAAPSSDVALSRALKARFDPCSVLNRGRFAGLVRWPPRPRRRAPIRSPRRARAGATSTRNRSIACIAGSACPRVRLIARPAASSRRRAAASI